MYEFQSLSLLKTMSVTQSRTRGRVVIATDTGEMGCY